VGQYAGPEQRQHGRAGTDHGHDDHQVAEDLGGAHGPRVVGGEGGQGDPDRSRQDAQGQIAEPGPGPVPGTQPISPAGALRRPGRAIRFVGRVGPSAGRQEQPDQGELLRLVVVQVLSSLHGVAPFG